METTAATTAAAALFMALFVLFAATTATAASPPSPPPSCEDEIVMVSPCLPYISLPPNDLDANVTDKCCEVFSSIVGSGSTSVCLCYLIRDPAMLGFSLNATKLLSLSSACSLEQSTSADGNRSLASICSAAPPLPPLQGPAGSSTTKPQPGSNSPSPWIMQPPVSTEAPQDADDETTTGQDDDGSSEEPRYMDPTVEWQQMNSAAATRYKLGDIAKNILVVIFSGQSHR